jgi:hypothetical protein
MGWQVQFGAGAQAGQGWQGDTHGSGQVLLYDAAGNPLIVQGNNAAATTQGYLPTAGLDGGKIIRAMRVGEYGTQKTTSEQILFHDAFEGSTVNAFWTQSTTTMTIAQSTGVLTLNNSGITTLNTNAIVTSIRQYPKYPRQPIYCRFRANITANVAGNHTLIEMGIGAPSGVTAIISNGAFFRWRADGTLAIVLSYNGTEQVIQVLAQGVVSTTSYYYYDIIIDDDFVRFIMSDSAGVPIVDQQISLSLTVPYQWAVSHLPSFARVYADATGGGTIVKLLLSAHTVQLVDALMNFPWPHQASMQMRQALINPTTYAQTSQLANGAAPAAFTPSNTAGGNAFLGGEALCNATATSENLLSVFDFTVPSPYTFMLTDIFIGTPLNTVVAVATTVTVLEWALIVNASSSNLSTATGLFRMAIPNAVYTAAVGLAANALFSGSPAFYAPQTPIPCLPGTHIHIAYKVIVGTATATEVYRNNVTVGGYFV